MRKMLSPILSLALGLALVPAAAHAQTVVKTAMAGSYSVTLRVLPAESFAGPHAAMARDAGAQPDLLSAAVHPNHHLVAFVKKAGKPVEDAKVSIGYRETSPKKGSWIALPVVRMHVKGKSLATTHYGNNVKLAPGHYDVRVSVNGSKPATFSIALAK